MNWSCVQWISLMNWDFGLLRRSKSRFIWFCFSLSLHRSCWGGVRCLHQPWLSRVKNKKLVTPPTRNLVPQESSKGSLNSVFRYHFLFHPHPLLSLCSGSCSSPAVEHSMTGEVFVYHTDILSCEWGFYTVCEREPALCFVWLWALYRHPPPPKVHRFSQKSWSS